MRPAVGVSLVVSFAALLAAQTKDAATACEALSRLTLPSTTITLAQLVDAGAFVPPAGPAPPSPRPGAPPRPPDRQIYPELPAFCRVAATLRPSRDSDIKVEVWLPASGWNGKFQAVGNGGWAGSIIYGGQRGLAAALNRGYATASTDTGHTGLPDDASFALGHPEKVVDFGYRAVHEMTVAAKAIVTAFYNDPPRRSYWYGCSTGGRQGITEAVRYPSDYDGIIAGAPAVDQMHLHGGRIALNQIVNRTADSYIPTEKHSTIHKAVLAACDEADGVKDGLLENPLTCRFDPGVLQCKGEDGPLCLTPAQVETARTHVRGREGPAYRETHHSRTRPWLRAGMVRARRQATTAQCSRRLPVRRLQEPRVGLAKLQCPDRHRLGGPGRQRCRCVRRSEFEAVLRWRRQTSRLPRLVGSAHYSEQHPDLRQEGYRPSW